MTPVGKEDLSKAFTYDVFRKSPAVANDRLSDPPDEQEGSCISYSVFYKGLQRIQDSVTICDCRRDPDACLGMIARERVRHGQEEDARYHLYRGEDGKEEHPFTLKKVARVLTTNPDTGGLKGRAILWTQGHKITIPRNLMKPLQIEKVAYIERCEEREAQIASIQKAARERVCPMPSLRIIRDEKRILSSLVNSDG
ncbi:MAG: hypothetical protein K0S07_1323 [Chlamydiales bacterium]|jgi:hypothetical protein|nr:hypothetical protein [Chlamydiales bacterium]